MACSLWRVLYGVWLRCPPKMTTSRGCHDGMVWVVLQTLPWYQLIWMIQVGNIPSRYWYSARQSRTVTRHLVQAHCSTVFLARTIPETTWHSTAWITCPPQLFIGLQRSSTHSNYSQIVLLFTDSLLSIFQIFRICITFLVILLRILLWILAPIIGLHSTLR